MNDLTQTNAPAENARLCGGEMGGADTLFGLGEDGARPYPFLAAKFIDGDQHLPVLLYRGYTSRIGAPPGRVDRRGRVIISSTGLRL